MAWIEDIISRVDGPTFKEQRRLILELCGDIRLDDYEKELLQGLDNLLAEIADVLYDQYGKDVLMLGGGFLNRYLCPCGEEWEDTWECSCNDRCPACNKEIEPYESKEVAL